MGTAFVAFWASVDGAVRDYCDNLRYRVLQDFHWQASVAGSSAVCSKPYFQPRLHSPAIRAQKQSSCRDGYFTRLRDACLGSFHTLARRAKLALGCLCQYSVFALGFVCDGFAINHHFFK